MTPTPYNLCSRCHEPGDATYRALKEGLDPDWFCRPCGEELLDQLAAWCVEHDRMVFEGVPEARVEHLIATLIASGARPPFAGRA